MATITFGCGDAPPTTPAAPTGLTASEGLFAEHVALQWQASAGAASYRLYRDDTLLAEVDASSFVDSTAAAGGAPSSPGALSATAGEHADKVVVSWAAAAAPAGATHTYAVAALNPAGESARSSTATGHRAPSSIAYQLSVDGGQTFQSVGAALFHEDVDAPAPTVTSGAATASQGTVLAHVELSVTGATASPGAARTYVLRASNAAGQSETVTASGFRGAGALEIAWEISAADSDAAYAPLAGASGASHVDTTAPPDGSGRYYRAVTAAGGLPVVTAPIRGFRAALPSVATTAPREVTHASLVATGALDFAGAPAATHTGICLGTSAAPAFGAADATCRESAAVAAFEEPFATLVAGQRYFVRAFARHPTLGVVYGGDVSIDTVPSSPANVAASDGTSTDAVTVTWNSSSGATGYRVYRDDVLLADVATTDYTDAGASAGGPAASPSGFAASDGVFSDRVALSWSAPVPAPGATHSYSVEAVNSSGVGARSPADDGHRAAYPVLAYELLDGTTWRSHGLVTSFDDTSAPGGTATAGTATASGGSSAEHVALAVTGHGVAPGATVTYELRAVNAAGPSQPATDTGYRGVGALSLQWQRSAADSDAGYAALPSATSASHLDTTAPASGEGRYYRVVAFAAGAAPATSVAVRGFRSAFPSSTPVASLWAPNARVHAAVEQDGVLYLGGDFTWVGPVTGSFATVSATTAEPDLLRAKVSGGIGVVYAMTPDGAGGWYIGGNFTHVDGVGRSNAARIRADGTLDPSWNPSANAQVYDLEVANGVVYAGGEFTAVGGLPRSRIAALDPVTGTPTAWNPNASAGVSEIEVSGSTVFVGGVFTTMGGQSRNFLAALDAASGTPTAWNPGTNSTVFGMTYSDGLLYVVGQFTTVGGLTRNRVAAIDATSGAVTAWNPNANLAVDAVVVSGSTVYLGGGFTSVGGQNRSRLAAVDATSGAATAWNPGANDRVLALAVNGTTVYAGGMFTTVGGQSRARIAAINASSAAVTAWNPGASEFVNGIRLSGDSVFLSGRFSSLGGVARNRLAALDLVTGEAMAWNPDANESVRTLSIEGTTVYAGGTFTTVGGQARGRLAALDATSGAVSSWNPTANGEVYTVAAAGGVVYAGGTFTNVGGQSRNRIAALDAVTGAATSWNPDATGTVWAVAVAAATVYVGGDFTAIGGAGRTNLAALSASTGAATAWNPACNGVVFAVTPAAGLVYAGGSFSTAGGQARNNLAAIDASTGAATAWNPSPNERVFAIAPADSAVFVGGNFTNISSSTRRYLAAVDPATGVARAWDPSPAWMVRALVARGSSLYAVGDFVAMAGLARPYVAVFDP